MHDSDILIKYLKFVKEIIACIPALVALLDSIFFKAIPISISLRPIATIISILLSLFSIFLVVGSYGDQEPGLDRTRRINRWAVFWMCIAIFVLGLYLVGIGFFEQRYPASLFGRSLLNFGIVLTYGVFFLATTIAFSLVAMKIHLKSPKKSATPPQPTSSPRH